MKINFTEEKCIMCGMCENVCPHGVFDSQAGKLQIVNELACIECGACQRNCVTGAIRINTGVG